MHLPITFKVNKIKPLSKKHWISLNSLDLIEIKLFNKLIADKDILDQKLIFVSLLTLSIYYIRSNSIKWFNLPKTTKLKLRSTLIKYGNFYYNESISLLRKLISRPKFNIELLIVVSELLNKVSIYEFKSLNNCLVFNKGVISIFSQLVHLNNLSNEIKLILGFLDFCLKTVYFPIYKFQILYEFQSMVEVISPFISLINHKYLYNHLQRYVRNLIIYFETNGDGPSFDHHKLYELLRRWLINLPPSMQLLEYLKDPIELIILKLYKTLSVILNNLFPFINYLFLTNFQGNLQLFHNPDYNSIKYNWHSHKLKMVDDYCIRVTTFFMKRLNILSIFVGSHNFMHSPPQNTKNGLLNVEQVNDNDKNRLQEIVNNINEVMIEKFNHQYIRYYNYLHFPCDVEVQQDVSSFIMMNPDLFSYNKYHLKVFNQHLSPYTLLDSDFLEGIKNFDSSTKLSNKRTIEDVYDPIFELHLHNLGGGNFSSRNNHNYSNNNKNNKKNNHYNQTYSYDLFFNKSDCIRIRHDIMVDYQELFNNYNPSQRKQLEFDINYKKGLDFNDHDTKDLLVNPLMPFEHFNNYNLKMFSIDDYSSKFSNIDYDDFNDTDNDLILKFYDDLNDELFS